MIPYERRCRILETFEHSEVVTIKDLKEIMPDISESTIRRDLKTLASEGEIILMHGGAMKHMSGSYDTSIVSRNILNINEKNIIAKYASELVSDGEVVYIDAGSTVLRMVKFLKEKDITIVSTNAMVAQELEGANCKCILVGGDLLLSTSSLAGSMTDSILENLFFDKAFIGVSGFSKKAGINTPDQREAKKKQIVLRNSLKSYVLADSSKSGKSSLYKVTDLKNVTIICEKKTPELLEAGEYLIAKR